MVTADEHARGRLRQRLRELRLLLIAAEADDAVILARLAELELHVRNASGASAAARWFAELDELIDRLERGPASRDELDRLLHGIAADLRRPASGG